MLHVYLVRSLDASLFLLACCLEAAVCSRSSLAHSNPSCLVPKSLFAHLWILASLQPLRRVELFQPASFHQCLSSFCTFLHTFPKKIKCLCIKVLKFAFYFGRGGRGGKRKERIVQRGPPSCPLSVFTSSLKHCLCHMEKQSRVLMANSTREV